MRRITERIFGVRHYAWGETPIDMERDDAPQINHRPRAEIIKNRTN